MFSRDFKNYQELKGCIERAADTYSDPLFPIDSEYAVKNAWQLIKSGAMNKVIEHDGQIVAFGLASVCSPYFHSRDREVQQTYYQTFVRGVTAVKALVCFHKTMIDYAATYRINKCTTSSIMDSQDTFYRILEKEGWIRRGCIMVYVLDMDIQCAPRAAKRGRASQRVREVREVDQDVAALVPFSPADIQGIP